MFVMRILLLVPIFLFIDISCEEASATTIRHYITPKETLLQEENKEILLEKERLIAKRPSLAVMIGQMLMIGFNGSTPKDAQNIGTEISKGRVGGIILFSRAFQSGILRNIQSKQQTTELVTFLQSKSVIPLFVGVDQEGGQVQRFRGIAGVPDTLSAAALAQKGVAVTAQQMDNLGHALRDMGVNLNFAPVVDLNINPQSPVIGKIGRSYGSTSQEVLPHALSVIQGLNKNNVIFAIKHFPGHGSADVDSHYGLPDITHTWKKEELEPYKELVQYSNSGMVLVGHLMNKNIDNKYPSSLSKKTINGMLREEIGWEGIVVTDDLQMQAITDHYNFSEIVIRSVLAGNDILLFGNNIVFDKDLPEKVQRILINAVRRGVISIERIEDSYRRIMKLKSKVIFPVSVLE
ncbi:MAG: glycoside hydrolase family 3 protein [Desulfovibrionaceae bacterium]